VGALPDLSRAVAIVGTRHSDPWALQFTRQLAHDLAGAGCPIVSGGALGIDTAAHEGALEADGVTLSVLASLEAPYPAQNRGLFARIARGGCVLAEADRVGNVGKHTFVERNRLVAALASVVVVIQAPIPSGTLSTAAFARGLGRPVLAVPAAPWDPRGAGCLKLLGEGAGICRSAADVLSLAAPGAGQNPPRALRRPKKAKEHQLVDEDQRAVVTALADGIMGADELCERTALNAPRVQRAILMLLLSKVIHEVGSGRYELADAS
jgi:DNA processing protein